MASREGNVIRAPGYTKGTAVVPEELMYSMVGVRQKGVTLKPNSGVYPAGTPLQYDSGTKKYVYATADANVVGFLRIASDTADPAKLGNIVLAGSVKSAQVTAAMTALGAGTLTLAGMASALGGKYNAQYGFIQF